MTEAADHRQYDIASHLVNFMLQIAPGRYRAIILGIKEGDTPEQSLNRAYGLTSAELIAQYGRSIERPESAAVNRSVSLSGDTTRDRRCENCVQQTSEVFETLEVFA